MSDTDSVPSSDHHLGFKDVRLWLANEAAGSEVKSEFSQLPYDKSRRDIALQFARFREIEVIMEAQSGFQVYSYEDLRDHLKLLALEGSTLLAEDVLAIGRILEQGRILKTIYTKQKPLEDSVWLELFEQIEPLKSLEDDIKRVVAADGEILDSASAVLTSIRQKLRRSAGTVRRKMIDLVKKYGAEGYLNEDQAGMRAGRLVLPVISSYKNLVNGVIQDISNTGTTTFIEPYELIEMNNQIRAMELEEQQEVQRILRELTAKLHRHQLEIGQTYSAIKIIDFHMALVKFSKTFACTLPHLSEHGEFNLKSARNPRLALQRKVVPLNLEMDAATHTLIITGPNAGGKTVALKTIGLLTMMANAGIPIPAAEGSTVPLVDRIFTDIGDQQSLINDLSTFSAHMQTIIAILAQTTSASLVLLDELGTGTDPAEGAALARSILETLGERQAKTIATTHLGDLKVFAHETEGVMNGAMEFDREGLKPTYRFLAGVPGSSYGFEISKRLGLAQDILERARTYTGLARDSMERLLQTLEAERVTLSSLKDANEILQRELRMKQKEMDSALKTVHKAERKADRDAARKAGNIISDARQTVEQVIRELRESQAETESIKDVHTTLDQAKARIESIMEATEEPLKIEKMDSEMVVEGARVTVLSLDQEGIILENPVKGKVLVEVEGKRLRIPLDWLGKAVSKNPEEARDTTPVNVTRAAAATFTLDLRGFRAEDAISELGRFLDQAVLSNLGMLQIIHGKGTGVIRKVVHEVLAEHSAVQKYRLGGLDEGGAGVTFVEMK